MKAIKLRRPPKAKGGMKRRTLTAGRWYEVRTHVGCCDCGLIHREEYKDRGGKLYRRSFRDHEATAAGRKKFKFPFVPRGTK